MNSGSYKDYYWVQWEGAFIDKMIERIPDILLNKFLVNTSWDSGKLCPSADELQQGWRSVGPLTYSPQVKDVNSVPHYCFEEWLIFNSPTEVSAWESVINFYGFTLTEPPDGFLPSKLWSQMEIVRPDSYIGLGDRWLVFVTRNKSLYEQALKQKDLETTASSS